MVSSILQKNERNSLSCASSLLRIVSFVRHNGTIRITDMYVFEKSLQLPKLIYKTGKNVYLHYGLKQIFLICKLWIHTVHWFLHIFVFILKICSLCSTLVKNWTNPNDPRSLVSLHIFLSEISAFLSCALEIQEIRRLKLSQKLKSVFNLSLFENFRNNLSPHVFTIFF